MNPFLDIDNCLTPHCMTEGNSNEYLGRKSNAITRALNSKGSGLKQDEVIKVSTVPTQPDIKFLDSKAKRQTSATPNSCRICLEEGKELNFEENKLNEEDILNPLICACKCKGSLAYIHQECLKSWIFSNYNISNFKAARCELCSSKYVSFNLNESNNTKVSKKKLLITLIVLMLSNLIYVLIMTQICHINFLNGHFSFFIMLFIDITCISVFFMLLKKLNTKVVPVSKDQIKILDFRDPRYQLNLSIL